MNLRKKTQVLQHRITTGLRLSGAEWSRKKSGIPGRGRNCCRRRCARAGTKQVSLNHTEEERLVFDYRSAEVAAELMIDEPGFGLKTCSLVCKRKRFQRVSTIELPQLSGV